MDPMIRNVPDIFDGIRARAINPYRELSGRQSGLWSS